MVPVPLFVVDDLLDCWPLLSRVLHRFLPEKKVGQVREILQQNGVAWDLKTLSLHDIKHVWRRFRNLGQFTLVDVESADVLVKIRLM